VNDSQINLQSFVDKIPFARSLKLQVGDSKKGFVQTCVDPSPLLFNHFETYQAGVYFTAGEITGGLLCGTFLDLRNNLIITKSSKILFQRPTNETLILTAELDEKFIIGDILSTLSTLRKTTVSVNVYIKTPTGKVVAICSNEYYLRQGIPRSLLAQRKQYISK